MIRNEASFEDDGVKDKKTKVFGNLPIDTTSPTTDDQLYLKHILHNDGDEYVNVPAKNILIEFLMQTTLSGTGLCSNNGAKFVLQYAGVYALIMTVWPYVWRNLNGYPSFANKN